jgi:hypothetical protein
MTSSLKMNSQRMEPWQAGPPHINTRVCWLKFSKHSHQVCYPLKVSALM